MALIKIKNKEEFSTLINEGTYLIDFFAPWCGACQMIHPVIDELQKELEYDILSVDIDKFPDIASEYKVLSIPTLILITDNIVKSTSTGFKNKEELLAWIKEEIQ